MSGSVSRLEKRYRLLLLSYPRAYRRERGKEIVDTLADLAPPGRTRPTVREAFDLIRHGLRARLGRPASRSVVVWAVLTAIVWALFSAAMASRLAWETARPLPSVARASAVFATVAPGRKVSDVQRSPATFVMYGQPLSRQDLGELIFPDGGEYTFGSTTGSMGGASDVDLHRFAEDAVRRLHATGWDVGRPYTQVLDTCGSDDCGGPTESETYLTARRGDDVITIYIEYGGMITPPVSISIERATPWPVYPASVAGGAVGAVIAWFVFGWASRRTDGRHPALRVLTALLLGISLFLWWLPIPFSSWSLLRHQLTEPHYKWHPLWEWLGQPALALFFLVGCVAALTGLAVAALPRRRPDPSMDVATG
ncbi:hypothetical protein [Rugosimonospora africana]|uniref:Uncharacterized protein n=1 Tax=Rugosimonospora africana TaxID=556532 RepID=A0A8J3QQZ8_9ACTN|nr:hypothetical protein [Rugosimonospora africana]GIH14974.1 hypothetical protein Raf01_31460 [Rugosimonospora africana]